MGRQAAWLSDVAAINPITHIVNAARALFTGGFLDISALHRLITATANATLGLILSTHAMKRRP
ncbi:hypothetical protein [Streptomyces sp. NPDC060035]|uniref:hypothetical protein n=1 Tax=Streptomyces sp. NPDC060035 TaxID=3347044 RepID=UPI0036BC3B65